MGIGAGHGWLDRCEMKICFRPKASPQTAPIQESIAPFLQVFGNRQQVSCRSPTEHTLSGANIGYQMLLSYAAMGLWKVSN